jgi:hypothetical protein
MTLLLTIFLTVGEVTATPANVEKPMGSSAPPFVAEWPQAQNSAQRNGYSNETLGTNFVVRWTHPFQPEKIYPQVQAIISGGKVFVGTEMGNLYAYNATTGAQSWKFSTGGPILASVAVSGSRVFFGSMDGAVYAVDTTSGGQAWKAQLSTYTGFSTAPVLADNKIMIGGRNGIFYALDPNSGSVLWQYDTGAPILMTAAWNGGHVYFGAMDMKIYALNSADGTKAWNSEVVPGMAFKDYWPVVTQGMVYVRTMTMNYLGLPDSSFANVANASTQQALLNDYDAHPGNYGLNMFRFNETNGAPGPAVIAYKFETMNGTTAPPCVDRDGYLIMPSMYPRQTYLAGWGRLNVNTRMFVDVLMDGTASGFGSRDETLMPTCTANLVLVFHTEEENANYTGAFNLNTRTWTHIAAGQTNRQMSNNTQGGGGNPASVANGWVYHIVFNELVARSTN